MCAVSVMYRAEKPLLCRRCCKLRRQAPALMSVSQTERGSNPAGATSARWIWESSLPLWRPFSCLSNVENKTWFVWRLTRGFNITRPVQFLGGSSDRKLQKPASSQGTLDEPTLLLPSVKHRSIPPAKWTLSSWQHLHTFPKASGFHVNLCLLLQIGNLIK